MIPPRLIFESAESRVSRVVSHPICRNIARWTKSTGILAASLVIVGAATAAWPYLFPAEYSEAPGPIQLARVYLDKQPKDTLGNFYFMLGTQMAARGQILVAEDLLGKAVKIQPDQADGFLNYGVVLEALDRHQDALNAYQQAVKIQEGSKDGVSAQTLYTMGLLQDKMGETDAGIETLQRALKIEPKNNLIAYDLGVLYSKQEDYENAAQFSKLSVEGLQDFAEGYNNYGYALAHLSRYDEALRAVNRSLELKPESAAALDTRGFVYFGMKKYPDALGEYKKALTLDPTIGEIYLHMGDTYEKMEDYSNAIRSFEQYVQLTPRANNLTEVRDRISRLKQTDFAKKSPAPALSGANHTLVQPLDANAQ